jgi:hypothetical protein
MKVLRRQRERLYLALDAIAQLGAGLPEVVLLLQS